MYRFLRALNFHQAIFQKILFKSVYRLVRTFPNSFFISILCLESKTIFIFGISLTVWTKTKCTTHQVCILSVRDITVEVSKIMEEKPFLTFFYSDIDRFNARNEKKRFKGFCFTIIGAETVKLFGQA